MNRDHLTVYQAAAADAARAMFLAATGTRALEVEVVETRDMPIYISHLKREHFVRMKVFGDNTPREVSCTLILERSHEAASEVLVDGYGGVRTPDYQCTHYRVAPTPEGFSATPSKPYH